VAWLSTRTGEKYRLLTEAEWEYAARAGTTGTFGPTADLLVTAAQFAAKQPADVGSFPANAFGLHDMLGNAWEWTEDCFVKTYNTASASGEPPPVTKDCQRTYRGGGWGDNIKDLRIASRGHDHPNLHVSEVGLRVAKTLE
jgi:formylglycine-generating enzyme required for sulfatase activity